MTTITTQAAAIVARIQFDIGLSPLAKTMLTEAARDIGTARASAILDRDLDDSARAWAKPQPDVMSDAAFTALWDAQYEELTTEHVAAYLDELRALHEALLA